MEFGCWFGKNLTLCESLRAIYEPYNYTRRIIGFDTFSGYPAASKQDSRSRYLARGGYAVPRGYVAYLRRLLEYHEQENPMAHIKKHEVVIGDVRRTLPLYLKLKRNPQTIVAPRLFRSGALWANQDVPRVDPPLHGPRQRHCPRPVERIGVRGRDRGVSEGVPTATRSLDGAQVEVPAGSNDHRPTIGACGSGCLGSSPDEPDSRSR